MWFFGEKGYWIPWGKTSQSRVEDQPTQPTNRNNLEFELKPTYAHFRGYICVASFSLGGGGLGYCFCLFKEDSLGNTSWPLLSIVLAWRDSEVKEMETLKFGFQKGWQASNFHCEEITKLKFWALTLCQSKQNCNLTKVELLKELKNGFCILWFWLKWLTDFLALFILHCSLLQTLD